MKRVSFIEHQGQKILSIDFSHCSIEEAYAVIERAEQLIACQPRNSVLTLTNVTGALYDTDVVEKLKRFALHNKQYVKKGSIIGVDGLKKIAYNSIMRFSGRHLLLFDEAEQAKNWLVDRRILPRLEDAITIEYTIRGKEGISGKGVTRDISMGGICFDSEKKIAKHTHMELKIYLPDSDEPVETNGRVAWDTDFLNKNSTTSHKIGVEFIFLKRKAHQRLFEYIFGRFNE